jgi:hypothetical protein
MDEDSFHPHGTMHPLGSLLECTTVCTRRVLLFRECIPEIPAVAVPVIFLPILVGRDHGHHYILDQLPQLGWSAGRPAGHTAAWQTAGGVPTFSNIQNPKRYQDHQDRFPCVFLYSKLNLPRTGLSTSLRGRKTHFYAAVLKILPTTGFCVLGDRF